MDETEIIPAACQEHSKTIKAINKDTVHKICSGQVVLSLAIAIKELVENSIDAGGTVVEVKLKNQGADYVEVIDNGTGVEECNFAGLTAKYHTSKIRDFLDLEDVSTFGFRGEALSSLCALSDMVITTRHASVEVGTRLELDHNGKIKKQTPCARPIGTTVSLTNIFSSLPVRRREFLKNIKKELVKMCQILQAYCLVSKNVRIICTNTTPKGTNTTLMCTSGKGSVLDNIQAIFGSKQVEELKEISQPVENGELYSIESIAGAEELNSSLELKAEDFEKLNTCNFKIEGWISSCKHGAGRSSKDRQFYFVNSRPCEPKNINKLVNEIYHRYNVNQSPFVFLNIFLKHSDVDVNLTPDKRQLLLNNEKVLLLALKKALLKTFSDIPSTFTRDITMISTARSSEQCSPDIGTDEEYKVKPNREKFVEVLMQWKAAGNAAGPCTQQKQTATKRKPLEQIIGRNFKLKKIQEILSQGEMNDEMRFASYLSEPEVESEAGEETPVTDFSIRETQSNSKNFDAYLENSNDSRKEDEEVITNTSSLSETNGETMKIIVPNSAQNDVHVDNGDVKHKIDCKIRKSINNLKLEIEKVSHEIKDDEAVDDTEVEFLLDARIEETEGEFYESSECIDVTVEQIKNMVVSENMKINERKNCPTLQRLKFKTEINPNKNKNAEEELQKEVTKDMFSQMEVVGQFNLGFIIAKLDDDLFIIDQHATDEKYNFETLQKTVKLHNQNLVIPQSLELTAINEMILIDNLKVFEMNGFKFHLDENAPPTKKVKLLAKPHSSNWQFGKEDIDELIFMLQDAPPHTVCRPSRIRSMFASRACRKSVMIGKALNMTIMKKLITHMGEIEHPWNCPHGRPTMRHLINISMLSE